MKIWVDGSGAGKYCFIDEHGLSEVFEETGTNNENEYKAVRSALLHALRMDARDVEIYSDSKLVISQLAGLWHIKEDRLRKLAQDIWRIIGNNNMCVGWNWIPREQNKAGKLLG